MGVSEEVKCWPASEIEVDLLPRGTCVETGRGTDLVAPFRSLPDGVFDNPRATRMKISDGAMPWFKSCHPDHNEFSPFILSQMAITYVDLDRNHSNDTLGGMPDGEEHNKDELHGQIHHATLDDDVDRRPACVHWESCAPRISRPARG